MVGELRKQQRYIESDTQSANILRLVIPQISKYKLAANPINYSVWYEYYLANNIQLNQAIDKNMEEGISITNELIESLFDTYIANPYIGAINQAQDEVLHIVSGLSEMTKTTDTNAENYQKSLEGYGEQLESPTAKQKLPDILSNLVSETQSMKTAMQTMRNHIDESQQEINVLRNKLDQVTAESLSDVLTGLANRKGFANAFEKAIAQNQDTNTSIALLMIDIDHFKKVNDTYGHLLGDRVIKLVADVITAQIKGQDTASRFGGEEYAVLLPNTSLNGAQSIAETVRKKIENARLRRSNTQESIGQITVSIGIASLQPKETLESLIDRADSALYFSKRNGRNRVTIDTSIKKLIKNQSENS